MAAVQFLTGFLRAQSARPSALLFFAGMFLVSLVSIVAVLEPVGFATVWQLQTTLSGDGFGRILAGMYAMDTAEHYLAHFYYDFLHPVWYAGLLALLLGRAMDRAALPASANGLLLLPLLAVLTDPVQNALHVYMVMDTANVSPGLVLVANLAGWATLAVIGLSLLALALLLLKGAARKG